MTIQVTGILRSPTGTPLPNKEIRIISTVGSLLVLEGSFKVVTSSATGLYDFNLEDGQYIIDVLYDDEAVIAGSSIVNAGTPTPVTLSELFLYTTPINPQQVLDLQLEFQTLIDNLQNAFDTEKQEIRTQLVDGQASTLQLAQTFTNDRLGAEMAVLLAQVVAGDASVLTTSQAYTDTAGNLIAADVTQLQADTLSVTSQFQATRDAQGVTNGLIRTEIADGIITAINSTRTYSDLATGNLQVLVTNLINVGDASVLQTAGINAQSLNDATEAFLLDQIVVSGQGSVAGYEAYTIASLGYLDAGTGLWVDGPLSSSFRAHTIATSDGQFGSITDVMSVMAKPSGSLVAKGSLISDVNGKITGYRHSNDGVTTDFAIIADNFSIGHMVDSVFTYDIKFNGATKLLEIKGDVIVDNSLSASALIADSITAREIQAKSITALEIASETITGREISARATMQVGNIPNYSFIPNTIVMGTGVVSASPVWSDNNTDTAWGFYDGTGGETAFGSIADANVYGTTCFAALTIDIGAGQYRDVIAFTGNPKRFISQVDVIIRVLGIEYTFLHNDEGSGDYFFVRTTTGDGIFNNLPQGTTIDVVVPEYDIRIPYIVEADGVITVGSDTGGVSGNGITFGYDSSDVYGAWSGTVLRSMAIESFKDINTLPLRVGFGVIAGIASTPFDTSDLRMRRKLVGNTEWGHWSVGVWNATDKVFEFASNSIALTSTFFNYDIEFARSIPEGDAIAGMNGFDDGTGTGLDYVRFWAGALREDARTAPYRIMGDGHMYATNVDISGNIHGSTITGGVIEGAVIKGGHIQGTTIKTSYIITDEPGVTSSWYTYQLYASYDEVFINANFPGSPIYYGYAAFTINATINGWARMAIVPYNHTAGGGAIRDRFCRPFITRVEAEMQQDVKIHHDSGVVGANAAYQAQARLAIKANGTTYYVTTGLLRDGDSQQVGDHLFVMSIRHKRWNSSDGTYQDTYDVNSYASVDCTWVGTDSATSSMTYTTASQTGFDAQIQVRKPNGTWVTALTKYNCQPYNATLPATGNGS